MGVKKFIRKVIDALQISNFKITSKKKSLKVLLRKLKIRRVEVLGKLKEEKSETVLKELKEELELLSFHIKKGKKKLNELQNS